MLIDHRVSMSRASLANLLKRIIQVVLLLLILSVLFIMLVMINQSLPLPVLAWAGVAILGLAAGLAARWRLRSHTLALKFLVAVLALAFNLWMLGLISAGLLGFTVSEVSTLDVNWRGLSQLGLGTMVAWISLRAKIGAAHRGKDKPNRSLQPTARGGKSRVQDKKIQIKPGKTKPGRTANQPFAWPEPIIRLYDSTKDRVANVIPDRWKPVDLAARSKWKDLTSNLKSGLERLQNSGRQARSTLRTKFTRRTRKSVVRLGTPRSTVKPPVYANGDGEIKFSGEIEHRCPFCLETVEKNGPRGVKICKICHTYHHADCWEVTGTCQVPHHYG